MSNLYVWDAANLYCGDEDPTKSKHLTLQNLRLPTLEEIFQDHHAGGARVAIEVDLGIKKLELGPNGGRLRARMRRSRCACSGCG